MGVDAKNKKEYNTLLFSLIMVIALMICGLVFNELTDSNIVELDAGAYVISSIIGIASLYISKLKDKPKDASHPLGYSGFVPVLNLIRSFMIVLICLKGIGESLGSLIHGPSPSNHKLLFIYAIITLIFNVISFFITHVASKRLKSDILKTDALEWKIDTGYNISILGAIFISYFLKFTSYDGLSNYVDPVFTIVLSVAMAYSPVLLFSEQIRLLSISTVDEGLHTQVITSFHKEYPHIELYQPEFTILQVGGVLWVDLELRLQKEQHLARKDYEEIKTAGEYILNAITSEYRLSFRFTHL